MFKCKACPEKDAHVASLRNEIEHLRSLLNTPAPSYPLTSTALEMDGLLSGQIHTIEIPDTDMSDEDAVASEASQLLSGTYGY